MLFRSLVAPKQELPDVPEIQSDNQEAVSVDKAEKYFQLLKCPLVVMDSGLFIEELKGFPGIYTKYALDTVGIKRIIEMLNDNFRAYTKRTVVYHDGSVTKAFTSEIWGGIWSESRRVIMVEITISILFLTEMIRPLPK